MCLPLVTQASGGQQKKGSNQLEGSFLLGRTTRPLAKLQKISDGDEKWTVHDFTQNNSQRFTYAG